MTKADIINEIPKNTGIEKVVVQRTVEALMVTVKDSLVDGENVYLRGFGSITIHNIEANVPTENLVAMMDALHDFNN